MEITILTILILGFYRVNYDPQTWENIANTLRVNLSHIHVLNRAQVRSKQFLKRLIPWLVELHICNFFEQ